jgi:hypothetical protein
MPKTSISIDPETRRWRDQRPILTFADARDDATAHKNDTHLDSSDPETGELVEKNYWRTDWVEDV